MSESMQLRDPLYKLVVRFGNGEMIQAVVTEQIDARMITPETRYAVISSFSCQNPSECTDITIINLRDLTFIKTERVTLEQLQTEKRSAGLHSTSPSHGDERVPKNVAQVKFI
ncbi:MAG TPA: hypothetical protein VIG62_05580 [Blastocatellia bacterium]|jgi:hypothetical protein